MRDRVMALYRRALTITLRFTELNAERHSLIMNSNHLLENAMGRRWLQRAPPVSAAPSTDDAILTTARNTIQSGTVNVHLNRNTVARNISNLTETRPESSETVNAGHGPLDHQHANDLEVHSPGEHYSTEVSG